MPSQPPPPDPDNLPVRGVVEAREVCRHCGRAIVRITAFGWLHVAPPDRRHGPNTCAGPEPPDRRGEPG